MADLYLRGWYIPADPKPTGDAPFWNPYWTDGEGNWIEAQTEGHTEVDFPDGIMWPILALEPTSGEIPEPTRGNANTTEGA